MMKTKDETPDVTVEEQLALAKATIERQEATIQRLTEDLRITQENYVALNLQAIQDREDLAKVAENVTIANITLHNELKAAESSNAAMILELKAEIYDLIHAAKMGEEEE